MVVVVVVVVAVAVAFAAVDGVPLVSSCSCYSSSSVPACRKRIEVDPG